MGGSIADTGLDGRERPCDTRRVLPARPLAFAGVAAGVTLASGAMAHDSNNPDAHRSMPNQVTAGITPMCAAHYGGRHPVIGAGPRGEISVASVPCIGASISFAREIGRHFELRLRVSYDKPFPEHEALRSGLHEIRATLGPSVLLYRLADKLTLTLGPEAGLYGVVLTRTEAYGVPVDPAEALGFTAGVSAAVRPWITYHTGFFAEVSSGAAVVASETLDLRSGWLGRVTIGWADRF
jgi:hypothetical protein